MARGSATAVRGAVSVTCTMTDLGRPGVIVSGICFLDHMLDQLVSHGQLGVELRATVDGVDAQAHCDYVTRTRGLQVQARKGGHGGLIGII
jgi:imidazoleglycerol phosphate dehydratase HisB